MQAVFDPHASPDERYWLGQLRLARFSDLATLSPAALEAEFARCWSDRADRKVADEVLASWGAEHGVAHLTLLAWYAEEKSGRAIEAAVRRGLSDQLRATYVVGRHRRLAPLAGLLVHAPHVLADVYLWDAWHSRTRATVRLVGQHRKLAQEFPAIAWEALGAGAAPPDDGDPETLRFERAIPRDQDALLVFRQHGLASVQRDRTDDRPRATAREDFTFLRFYDHGNRVDITSRDVDAAVKLTATVGSRLFGAEVTYTLARQPLTRAALDHFLERLLDPKDPVFHLQEMVATASAVADPPLVSIVRPGRGRVEEFTGYLRRDYGVAADSRSVDRVKISFVDEGEHYRMALFFPEADDPEDELALSLADTTTNKDTVDRFRARMLEELKVEIHPKVADARRRRRYRSEAPRPRKLSAEDYAALLAPRLDMPAKWQVEELEDLAGNGLVEVAHETVFRCGDSRMPSLFRPTGSLHCPAEVTLPYGRISDEDGFAQAPGTRIACENGHEWVIDRVRPAWWHRIRVTVNVDAAARWLAGQLERFAWYNDPDEPGVWVKRVPGQGRRTVVLRELATDDFLQPDVPRCRWIALTPTAAPLPKHHLTLAELLAEGVATIPRSFGDPEGAPMVVREPDGPAADGTPWIEFNERGTIMVAGRPLVGPEKPRFRLLFALLQGWGEEHGWEALASRAQLAGYDQSGTLDGQAVNQLLTGIREEVGTKRLDEFLDNQGKHGIRVRAPFRVRGFSLEDEIDAFKMRTRPGLARRR